MIRNKYLLALLMSAGLLAGPALAQDKPAAPTQTQMKNEVPTTPQVNLELPDAPDINVTTPASNTSTHTSVTEHTDSTLINDSDDADSVSMNGFWLYVLLGVLAVMLIVMMLAGFSRRTVYED